DFKKQLRRHLSASVARGTRSIPIICAHFVLLRPRPPHRPDVFESRHAAWRLPKARRAVRHGRNRGTAYAARLPSDWSPTPVPSTTDRRRPTSRALPFTPCARAPSGVGPTI